MGWTGILVPETYGGSDLGYLTFGVILEQLVGNFAHRRYLRLPTLGPAQSIWVAMTIKSSDGCQESLMAARS